MITLREYKNYDLPLLVEYLNDPSVTQYLSSRLPQPYTAEDAHWWISTGSKDGIVRAIEYEGILVGTVGAHPGQYEHARSAEVGYWLARKYWGKGIATAALQELTGHVLDNSQLVRLYANVFAPNAVSMRVLEKAGFRKEAVLEKAGFKGGSIFDMHLYALVK